MTGFQRQTADQTAGYRLLSIVSWAAGILAEAGIGSARAEAEQLAAHVAGVSRGQLALVATLTSGQRDRFEALVVRRARREPLQHVLGSAAFRYLELAVGPGVFVPRPETELLAGWGVEQAARLATERRSAARAADERAAATDDECAPATPEVLVVDLCSGSGAIALAVANEVPAARVVAVERSLSALDWLRRNAADRAAAGDRPIQVLAGDVTDPGLLTDPAGLGAAVGRVDVLLCNPPYVPDGTDVPPEVGGHDPAEAVFGGADGLAVIRAVIERAVALLRPGGVFGVEHDDTHGTAVPELLRADGRFVDVTGHLDLVGRPRFATARRAFATDAPGRGGTWQTGTS